ncbi:alpha/beta fold hydrolase [Alkalihalobacillus sp. FSL R5-0424]
MDTYTVNHFSCKRDGLTIRGKEFKPEGDDLPSIIISHGFGGNGDDLVNDCAHLASLGYVVYSFDFCGGSVPGKGRSDGQTTDMTILTERDDLLCVIDYIKTNSYVDQQRISLLGFSQGGFVSALAAAKRPDDLQSLILFYPALCIPDHARNGTLAGSSYDINQVPEAIDCGKMLLGKVFHDTVVQMDPYKEITPYPGPVLLIHGTADATVPYSYALKASDAYAPEQCHLQLIKGAGHHFTEEQQAAAMVSVSQFLSGKKEVLTINVHLTGHEIREDQESSRVEVISFEGDSESRFFKGVILPGAEDVQTYKNGQRISIRAEYTLEGFDHQQNPCHIHIVNQEVNRELKPRITTNSPALRFLNDADTTASIESYEGRLTVRIYSAI